MDNTIDQDQFSEKCKRLSKKLSENKPEDKEKIDNYQNAVELAIKEKNLHGLTLALRHLK